MNAPTPHDHVRHGLRLLQGGTPEPQTPRPEAVAGLQAAMRAAGSVADQLAAAGLRIALTAEGGRVRAALVESETGRTVREFPLADLCDPSRLDVA